MFGDPLIGSWALERWDAYGPLSNRVVEGADTTTTSAEGGLDFADVEGSEVVGTWWFTVEVVTSGPSGSGTETEESEEDAAGREADKGEYDVDVDGVGDWLCEILGSSLVCDDGDDGEVHFRRTG